MSNSFSPPGGDQPRPDDQHPAVPSQYGAPQGQPSYGQYGAPLGQPAYGQYGAQDPQQQGQYGPGYYAPAPVVRPPSIDKAVLLMKIGAGLSILSSLLILTMRNTLREASEETMRRDGSSLTASQLDSLVTASIVAALVGGVIGALLWWWMAVKNGKGRSWARIVASVFFLISMLQGLFALTQPSGGALSLILTVVQLLVGAGAVWFLWQKESSRFYEDSARTPA